MDDNRAYEPDDDGIELSYDSIRRALDWFLTSGALRVSHEEARRLREQLDDSAAGRAHRRGVSALWTLLEHGAENPADDGDAPCFFSGCDNAPDTLDGLMNLWANAVSADVTVINCALDGFTGTLSRALSRARGMRVDHRVLIGASAEHASACMHALAPLIGFSSYRARYLPVADMQESSGAGDMNQRAFARVTDESGNVETHLLYRMDDGRYTGYAVPGDGLYRFLLATADDRAQDYRPLMMDPNNNCDLDGLEDIVREAYELERECDTLYMRPDIAPPFVSADLMAGALCERLQGELIHRRGEYSDIYRMNLMRNGALTNGRRVQLVLLPSAMREFIRTGRQVDHMHLLRPFTPQERLTVLEDLFRMTLDNPNFELYFWAGTHPLRPLRFTVYRGRALRVSSTNDQGRYTDTLFEMPALAELMYEFFKTEMQPAGLMSRDESRALLRELIEMARDRMDSRGD